MTDNRTTTWSVIGLRTAAVILLTAAVLLPVAWFLLRAMPAANRSLDGLREMLLDGAVQASFLRTVSVAFLATGLASLVAVPAALAIARGIPWARALIVLFGILPLAMPPFVTAALLARFGRPVLAERLGALPVFEILMQPDALLVVTYALHYFPLIVFCLATAVAGMDRATEDSARNLGAGVWITWRLILLPLATPAFILGATLMLLRVIEDVASPMILGVDNMLAPAFFQALLERSADSTQLVTSGVLLLGLAIVLLLVAWNAFRLPPDRYAAAFCSHPPNHSRSAFVTLAGSIAALVALGLAVLPQIGLFYLLNVQAAPLIDVADANLAAMQRAVDENLPTLSTTLLGGVLAGLMLALVSTGLGMLGTAQARSARLLRGSVTLMIAIPGVLLAAAYQSIQQSVTGETIFAAGAWLALVCVVVVKLLPLGHYLAVTRLRRIHPALAETAQTLAGQRRLQYATAMLGALSGMLTAVVLLGVVGTLTEISAALVLFEQTDLPFAQALFAAADAAGTWALPAAVLFTGAFGMLVLAVISTAGHCERRVEFGISQATSLGEHW